MVMALAGLSLGAAAILLVLSHIPEVSDTPVALADVGHLVHHEEASVGLCPWRNPDRDRQQFFPASTDVREEILILSGKRPEVARQLGRPSTGEENALKVYRIMRHNEVLGAVVAWRVHGESGVIELLLAVGKDGNVAGARLQRIREPEAVTHALQSAEWLGAFVGKNRTSPWRLDADLPGVPASARPSAVAILDAAHTLLVLLAVGDSAGAHGDGH